MGKSFVERVQNGKVASPTQPSFTLAKWSKEYSKQKSPSGEDEKLYEAGLWFHEKLKTVRDVFESYKLTGVTRDQAVRTHVGLINVAVYQAHRSYHEHIKTLLS